MSLAVIVSTQDGIAISADSRAVGVLQGEPAPIAGVVLPEMRVIPYADGYTKLAAIGGKYLIAWLGAGPAGSIPTNVLRDLEAQELAAPSATSDDFLARVESVWRDLETLAIVAWIDDRRIPCVRAFDRETRTVVDPYAAAPAPFGTWAVGYGDDVVHRLIIDPRLGKTMIQPEIFPIAAAANLSRFLVQTVIDLHSFELHGRPVGGSVQTAIAPVQGAARIVVPPRVEVRDFGSAIDNDALPASRPQSFSLNFSGRAR